MRVGDGDVDGIPFNTITLEARGVPVDETAEKIVKRLRMIVPTAPQKKTVAKVFLAEAMSDLEDDWERIKAFLEEDAQWSVVTRSITDSETTGDALKPALAECRAFVQLLGPLPWKPQDYNRIQYEAAEALKVPCFRHRNSEMDLDKLKKRHSEHFRVITAGDVVASSFDDFKKLLRGKLDGLRQIAPPGDGATPLVRVAVRSRKRDMIWPDVQRWISTENACDYDEVVDGETFTKRYEAEPCHGFMILYDEETLNDASRSPLPFLRECRDLQLKATKDKGKCPPVAVVFWEPPPADDTIWGRLLPSTPLHLVKVPGSNSKKLEPFFAQVRRAAQ